MVTDYAEEPCLYSFDRKAGHGFVSDGVPELVGDGDKSREVMPPPPRASKPVATRDRTVRMRKPWKKTN